MPSRAAALSRSAIVRRAGVDQEVDRPAVDPRLDLEMAAAVALVSTTLRAAVDDDAGAGSGAGADGSAAVPPPRAEHRSTMRATADTPTTMQAREQTMIMRSMVRIR